MEIVENYAADLVRRYGSALLSRSDLAAELGRRSTDALRISERGDLRGLALAAKVQIGRHVRFRAIEVARWIEAQGVHKWAHFYIFREVRSERYLR